MNKRKTGIILIVGSVLIWLIDRFTGSISSILGAMRCGERYLQPMDGFVGDMSCGFNDDMYLVVLLFVVLLVGIALCITQTLKSNHALALIYHRIFR